jgi:hypothetical protein
MLYVKIDPYSQPVTERLKHLPGRHDQMTHGRSRGSNEIGVPPVTVEELRKSNTQLGDYIE